MPTENVTTKFKVDISDLKKGIAEANKAIKTATAEFKNATAGMDKWSDSADGLSAKIQQQNKIVDAEKKKLDLLKQQLDRLNKSQQNGEKIIADLTKKHDEAAKTYGESSNEAKAYAKRLKDAQAAQERNTKAAEELNLKIINQDTAVKNAESQVKKYETALDQLTNQTETLTDKIDRQETELSQLKTKYAEVAATQGKNSTEAKELAREISNLSGDLKNNKSALNDAEKAADEFDNTLEKTSSGGLSVFAVALGNVIANLVTSAINKLADLAKETIEVGKAFDTSMSQVQAVSGASGDELEQLRDKAKEMGSTTKFTASEAADAFNYMAMAGWKTEDMLDGISGVLNLAAASGSDLATTSDIVTDALTAMGYSAADAGRLADVMAAASSNANTNVEMMGQTFKYAAPIVGALGYDMEDTAVAIGLMANAGIKADQAGTSLRSILTRLSVDTDACRTNLEEMGVEVVNSDGSMRDLSDVIVDLRRVFDGLSESEQTALAKNIAGQEAMSGLLAIVNAAPEDFNKLTDAVANSEGAAQEMADTMLDNLGGDMTLLSSKLEGVQLAIYEKFEPALRKGVEVLDKLLDGVQFIVDHSAEFIAAIAGIGTALTVFTVATMGVEGLKKAFLGLTIVQKAVTAAQWLMNVAMNANPLGIIISLIAGLVVAFVVLWKKSEKFRNFWIGLWETIKTTMQPVIKWIVEKFGELWEFLQPIIEKIKTLVSGAFTEISEMAAAWWGAVKAVWDLVFPYFQKIWEDIKAVFAAVAPVLQAYFAAAWEMIKFVWDVAVQYFSLIWENIKVIFSAVKNTFVAWFSAAWEGIKFVWDTVTGYFKMIWDNIKLVFSVVEKVLRGDFSGAWDAIKQIWNNVTTYFSGVWKGVKDVFSKVKTFFSTAFSEAWEAIKGVFKNVGTFFGGIWDTIKEKFTSIGTKIGDAIGGAFKTAINAVLATVEKGINFVPNAINKALKLINELPGVNIPNMPTISLPRLARGGIVDKATLAEIGEDGAEAVLPLEKNKQGLKKIAQLIAGEMNGGGTFGGNGGKGGDTIYNFNQTNNSPKSLSRYEIYRQTKNLINAVKVQGG